MNKLVMIISMLAFGCASTPTTQEENMTAHLDDGQVCIEENYDLVEKGWSYSDIEKLCSPDAHWGQRYIIDNCRRCEWRCCTNEG